MSRKPRRASDKDVNAILSKAPIENLVESFYNAFLEANIRARADAGIKEMVIREAIGGCCPWCQNLAGIYEYGTEPKDIFKRHDNCTCIVTFRTEEGYTDVWTNKKFETELEARIAKVEELERKGILNNESNINERIARVEKLEAKRELKNEANRNKRIDRDEGQNYYDATSEWKANTVGEKSIVEVTDCLVIDGVARAVDGKNIISDHTEEEMRVAQLIVDNLGGNIKLMPRAAGGGKLSEIKSADYLYMNIPVDLKSPTSGGKHTLYNVIKNYKQQADTFVIDISKSTLNEYEAVRQIEEDVFRSSHTEFVKTIILIDMKTEKMIGVFNRI